MLWMIVLVVTLNGAEANLMSDPKVAFVSEEKCNDAIAILKESKKTELPLKCETFHIIGGVPLETY